MVIHTRYDELVDPNALKPHPKNANKHPEEQIERLAKILNYQGWRYPIKVSRRSGFVTSGHGRILAAKHLGWTEVPVNYQDYEDEDQEHADVHSDNAIASWAELDLSLINTQMGDFDPGFDLDLLGIKDFTLDMSDKEFGSGEDEVPEAPPEPVVKRGELWILGEHRLLIDDCTSKENVERLMAGEKADMVFTSPPYADQRDYGGEANLEPSELSKIFNSIGATSFFVNLGLKRHNGEIVQYWDEYIKSAKANGLKLVGWNVWDKGDSTSLGSKSDSFTVNHEFIFIFSNQPVEIEKTVPCKNAGSHGDSVGGAGSVRGKDGAYSKIPNQVISSHKRLGTVIKLTPDVAEKINHPAKFPVKLPQEFIQAANPDTVIDPFLGSGSTLIACEKTNRRCFGMEIDPTYGQVIIERFQKFSGKKAIREDGVTFDSLKIE